MAALVKAWIVLVALTLAAMGAGAVEGRLLPFIVQTAVILAVAGFKAWTILREFLDMRSASHGWRVSFAIYLVVLGGSVFAIYAAGCALAPGQCSLLADGSVR